MVNKMNRNLELLTDIYKNSEMGVFSTTTLMNKIKAKENEINQLIKKIQNKYDEIDAKYKETAKKYYNVLKKCREDLKLIGDTRSKNNEEFYEGWLIK